MTRKDYALLAVAAVALWIASCSSNSSNGKAAKAPEKPIFFVSVTGDGEDDPQRTDMALKLAGFALEENREVVLFFNVKGVHLPTKDFPADRKFKDDAPLKSQLEKLIEKGAIVHVCPVCMKALDVQEADLIEGAKVTTRESLFAKIGSNTTAFTY